jgi:excisionase family DNA binding protein
MHEQYSELKKRLLTVKEAAKFLGLKQSRVRKAVAYKEIPFTRIGRLVRFDPVRLNVWLRETSIDQTVQQKKSGIENK